VRNSNNNRIFLPSFVKNVVGSQSAVVEQYFQPHQQPKRCISAAATAAVTRNRRTNSVPTSAQLKNVFFASAIPFIGFGFIDNAIMIIAGDYIDMTIGVSLGISTMAAAGLGNLVSDVCGVWAGSYVEKASLAMGFKLPKLSEWQLQHKTTKRYENLGSALGLTIGCLLGMFPLLLMDANKDQELKEKKQLKLLFQNIFDELGEIIDADAATLFLCDDEKQELYSFINKNKTTDAVSTIDKLRVPFYKGVVGACAKNGGIINVKNASKDKRFYNKYDNITGFQTKTILAVPVFNHDGAVIGVLEAINKNSNNENHFTTDDEQLLVSISSHIGVAISSILGEHNEKKELMTVLKLVKHHHT
jgi:putative methionine-R-sulfoxide reductase with GAF domain